MKHIGVHMNSFKSVRAFQIELEFGSVGSWGYMDRRVSPPKRVTSPTWGPPSACEQALSTSAVESDLTLIYLIFISSSQL